jgi:heme a synthase
VDFSRENVWLNRFAMALAAATFFLVALGGVVTTKGVGMAVPDWPPTYGQHMFLFPVSKWQAGIFFEHSHRLFASLVGLFAGVFAIWTWLRGTKGLQCSLGISAMALVLALLGIRHKPGLFVGIAILCVVVMIWAAIQAVKSSDRVRWLGLVAFAAVIIQGVLGGLRVLLDAHGWGTALGIFHASLAQLFFLLTGSLVVLTSKWWRNALPVAKSFSVLRRLVLVTTAMVFLQLLFGAIMRHQHAGLAVTTFPLAYGKLWPATDAASVTLYSQQRMEANGEEPITAAHVVVHMLHRYTAVFIAALIIVSAAWMFRRSAPGSILRKLGGAWIVLMSLQVTLGVLTITTNRKVDITTAHVAVGALTFLIGWLSFLVTSRQGVELEATAERELVSTKGAELEHA